MTDVYDVYALNNLMNLQYRDPRNYNNQDDLMSDVYSQYLMNLEYKDPRNYNNQGAWMTDVYADNLMNLKGFNFKKAFSKKNLRKAGNTMKKVGSVGAAASQQLGAPPVVTTGFNYLGKAGQMTKKASKAMPKNRL